MGLSTSGEPKKRLKKGRFEGFLDGMRRVVVVSVAVTIGLSVLLLGSGVEVRDLKPRKETEANTRFVLRSDEETGVRFVPKALAPETLARLQANPSYSNKPGVVGVCAGDFDGDEIPDLFFSYPFGGHRLFRNLGGFRFEDVTEKTGLLPIVDDHWSTGCCFVDYDGDGDLDLFVAGTGDVNLLLENLGGKTFRDRAAALGLSHKGANVQMAFADYDLDGDLDGYLVTNRETDQPKPPKDLRVQATIKDGVPLIEEKHREVFDVVFHPTERLRVVEAGEYDHLFRNDGDKFTDVSAAAGLSGTDQGLSASWFDYDDDGRPDLYVANDFYGPDRLYRNKGGGALEEVTREILPYVPWFSMGTDVADVNNDGLLDLMGSDMAGSNHYKAKVGMGDMDKNSWFLTTSRPPQYMRNALYLNAGAGRFLEVAQMAGVAGTDWTWSLKFADLDNDGLVDLYGTNGMANDLTNSDLTAQAAALPDAAAKAAFWRERPPKRDRNFAYRNQGNLRFASASSEWGLDFLGVSYGAALADFDGDGDLDLAVASLEDPFRLYENVSITGHLVTIRLRGAGKNTRGVGAKVTLETSAGLQVRYHNACQGYASANDPVLHFGLGEADRIRRLTVRWPLGALQTFENLPADKHFVITEPDPKKPPETPASPDSAPPAPKPLFAATDALAAFPHRENDFDDYKVQPLLPHRLSRLGPGMAWGDADGDGDDDLFLGSASGHPAALALNDGKGAFARKPQIYFENEQLLPFEDMGALFLDADSDGDQDLFVASGGFDPRPKELYLRDRLFFNDGKGAFTLSLGGTPNLRDSSGPVAAADFDQDGDLDLFIGGRLVRARYPTTPNSRLLRNESGVFSDVTDSLAPGLRSTGMVTGALWSDVDADGLPDLLLTHEWGPVAAWRNTGGKLVNFTEKAGLSDLLGWWTGIAAADVDEDGDLDYAVGNMGLNAKYHATKKKPYLAYYGDLDGSGVPRFVEACHEDGGLFPVRGKSCSTHAIPSLAKKFTTFHAFASAGLREIYAPARLQAAQRLVINELASGLLLNDGKGRFTFRPLPRLAQTSAVFGLSFGDFDADGHQDLALAQNFHSPQPETGRFAGGLGLVLRGNGDGAFTPLRLDQSGFLLPGDAKALALVDLNRDARPDLVATRNLSTPQIFLNRAASGSPLRVRLRGPPGNLRGIGARVTLRLRSGKKLVGEMRSGSSYLTGAPPALHFGIPAGDALEAIHLRAPNGKTATHKPAGPAQSLLLEVPR